MVDTIIEKVEAEVIPEVGFVDNFSFHLEIIWNCFVLLLLFCRKR